MAKQRRKPTHETYELHVGDNIRKLRAQMKWSQARLGEEINTSRSNISNMERTGSVTSDMKDRVAKAFGITRASLENVNYQLMPTEPDDYIEPRLLKTTMENIEETCAAINARMDNLLRITNLIARRIDIPSEDND